MRANFLFCEFFKLKNFARKTISFLMVLFLILSISYSPISKVEKAEAATITAGTTGTQTASLQRNTADNYVGGAFSFSATDSVNVTGITITESGTIDGQNNLDNIKLFYENDTSNPYDCASESYAGTESQYGSTDTNGFSGANGTSPFSATVGISTTSTLCVYPVLDVGSGAAAGETIEISIASTNDYTVSTGVKSGTPALAGTTTILGLTQGVSRFFENANGAIQFGASGVATSASASTDARSVAKDSAYLYIAGYEGSNPYDWRIEKRLLTDGSLDSGFGASGVVTSGSASSLAGALAVDSTYMYVLGMDATPDWRVEKRKLTNGNLCTAAECGTEFGTGGVATSATESTYSYAIVISDAHMFLVGQDANNDWRIEKRSLSDGSLDTNFGTAGVVTGATTSFDAREVAIDSSYTYLYIAGRDANNDWRIEKRRAGDGALDLSFGTNGVVTGAAASDTVSAIAIDSTYMYVGGNGGSPYDWRIEKRLLSDGSLVSGFGTSGVVTSASTSESATAMSIDDTYMYVFGYDSTPDWRIEKRLLSDGSLDSSFGTSGVVTGASASAYGTDMVLDDAFMYLVGSDSVPDWRIEKRFMSDGSLVDSTEPTVGAPLSSWYNSAWSNRKKITLDDADVSGSTNLTNFPVLINLASDSDLAADAQDDGDDIVFTSGDGLIKLDHEIESFNGTTGALVAWVEVPTLFATVDTNIYMYYGNASAASQQNAAGVWNSNYKGVWHLPNGTTLTALDSTSNNNDGTLVNTPTAATGKIDGAGNFVGTSSEYVNIGNVSSLDMGTSDWTASAWVKTTTTAGSVLVGKAGFVGDSPDAWWLGVKPSGTVEGLLFKTARSVFSTPDDGTAVNDNAWHHIAVTWTRSGNMVRYVDGSTTGTNLSISGESAQNISSTKNARLGARDEASELKLYTGDMDEARVSNVARSADWIATEFNNQNSPSSFYDVNAEESYTAAMLTSSGQAFRLRALVHAGGQQLGASGETFKLQYAAKSGTCDTAFSGESYADITTSTPISFYNNSALADGDNIISNPFDPSDGDTKVLQEYEEANNFTNAVAAIPADQDGVWDFALYDNGASQGTSYCIRAVKSSGAVLDSYTAVAEISTPAAALTQFSYVWRGDDGSQTGASYLRDRNRPLDSDIYIGDNRRLRIGVSNTGNATATNTQYRLEYSSGACSSWGAVPTSAGSDAWVMVASGSVSNATATTDSAFIKNPANKTFVAGQVMTTANETGGVTLTPSQFTEVEYSVEPTANVVTGTLYCFRVTNAGSAAGFTYTEQPQAKAFAMVFVSRSGGVGNAGGESSGSGSSQGGGGAGGGGGGGGTATGNATISSGAVTGVNMTNGGSGYSSPPSVAFCGGGGSGAAGTAVLTADAVTSVTIDNGGSNYSTAPSVLFGGTCGGGQGGGGGDSGALPTNRLFAGAGFAGIDPGLIPILLASLGAIAGVAVSRRHRGKR